MFENIKKNPKNSFYPVKSMEIRTAEMNMGIIIPEELVQFYLEVGYGFLETKKYNINRIMDPSSLEEFRFGKRQFQNSGEVELLKEYMRDKLYFFEVNESLYLSIGITKMNKGKIYYFDEEIANDINEFLNKYLEDEEYFLK